jgi:uncharacterized protein YbaP (TraB family)/uncharacterized membrane protein YphA (DoxX/SURF4 family)
MKFLYDRRVVALLRIFLGLLFVAAALPKLQDPEAFAKSVSNYRLLAETPGRILALVLPPLELLIGVFLIVGIFDAGASAISFALMVTFTLAVGIALGRGLDISCGCFETEGGSKVGMKKIVENLLLVAAAWIVHRGDRSWLSLGAWTRSRRMATAAGIALVSIATAHIAQAQQSATPKTTPAVKPAPSKRALPPMNVPPAEGPTRPFLWLIDRSPQPPAFLYGTIHLPDPRVLQLPEIVEEAFRGSDVFVSEIPLTEETNKAIAAESVRNDGETLAMILPPDVRERADKFLQRHGFTLAEFSPLEIYTFAIQLPLLEYVRNPSPPMDALLHSRAVTAGKTTKALETPAEQLAVFEGLTRDEQIELLSVTLDDLGDTPAGTPSPKIEELVQAYLSGDPAKLDEDLFGPMRNVRLASRMEAGLREDATKPVFYAVGAGHMIGPDGIVGRLQKKGWKLKRLQAADLESVRKSLAEEAAASR